MDSNKLRDVLKKARLFMECSPLMKVEANFGCLDRDKICAEIDAALSEPVKNCEVGTPEEQEDRFRRYCNGRGTFCGDCPLYKNRRGECRFAWAQMPYGAQKGGAE